ncbi:vitellogenin receptor [Prorops nasuta]|uniref:vitellogenin receptor n=1 Tax=Prorops nasuta TaxID=863751 RepID=UPI0034CE8B3D
MIFAFLKILTVTLLCIYATGHNHCDEHSKDWFACGDEKNTCISSYFLCDGEYECPNGADEEKCSTGQNTRPARTSICQLDEYMCKDESCIPLEKFCDLRHDCRDESDEYENCVKDIKCSKFQCESGHCINTEWKCDGMPDCPDKSDEENCDNYLILPEDCTNEFDRYMCNNNRCISLHLTCNGNDDCGDKSDENDVFCLKANQSCLNTELSCEHYCRASPKGAICSCKPGFKLQNQTCIDNNECEHYGICDQRCINFAGGYSCSCENGYNLEDDKRTCKVDGGDALMVFSNKHEIRGYYLQSRVYTSITGHLQHAVGVSMNANHVYWSEITSEDQMISRVKDDGTDQEIIVSAGLSSVEDLAVDWITNNVYFTDSGHKRIGVCDEKGTFCTILITERTDKPRGIALLPSKGIMYWSDWSSTPHISMASMDGKNAIPFITENIAWPNGLSIDYPTNRLYWVDAKHKVIESILLTGDDRRVVLKTTAKHPFSLAIFENKLFWSDWELNSINSCNKFTGKDWETLVTANNTLYGLHIYHSALKPKSTNPCAKNPCDELCLINSKRTFTCACTMDKQLNVDGHSCNGLKKMEHLFIVSGDLFMDYYHEILGKPKLNKSVTMKSITALTYDSLKGRAIVSDLISNSIIEYDIKTGEEEVIMNVPSELIGGMSFDYIGNNIYWTNMKNKTVEIFSRNTKKFHVVHYELEPSEIILAPEESLMFVVFRERNDRYSIIKMQMSGLFRVTLINDLFGPRVSLHYDKVTKRIFWADQGKGSIEVSDINGNNRYIIRTGITSPVGLSMLGDYLFWNEYDTNKLYFVNTNSTTGGYQRVNLPIQNVEDKKLLLTTVHGIYKNIDHPCYRDNGYCSDVCIVAGPNSYHCACSPGTMLGLQSTVCGKEISCPMGQFQCGDESICIDASKRCNNIIDCLNGEDEADCGPSVHICGKEKFTCKNGECIDVKQKCDSHYDCSDKSDEMNCTQKRCQIGEFQCDEGTCISKYSVCNRVYDCSDFSDELGCAEHTCDSKSFMCKIRSCIPKEWECDGQKDCDDGSDEGEHCITKQSCEANMFTCLNGRCVDLSLKCNGVDDCNDYSDETFCQKTQQPTFNFAQCKINEYKCQGTSTCLPEALRCNGNRDCPQNDDEEDCARCNPEEYVCDNAKCISQSWVCDKTDDCGDGSDEKDCGIGDADKFKSSSSPSHCEEFKCSSDGSCLSFTQVCDGVRHCFDGSDERNKCSTACVKENPCEHVCHKTPNGPVCSCQKGFRLDSDGYSCTDIDECKQNKICSQTCQNTRGSYVCGCYDGYVLQRDKKSCKAIDSKVEIITTAGEDLRVLTPTLSYIKILRKDPNLDILSMDFDAKMNTIYWSNDKQGTITKLDMKSNQRKVIVTGARGPETLAVDWITGNVYFFENDLHKSIKACNMEKEKCALIIATEGSMRVTALAVDPKHGKLYWSQVKYQLNSSPFSEIYQASMMGSELRIIVHENLGIVNGLTIDHAKGRLYWSDAFFHMIERSDPDGSNREIFKKGIGYQPLSINILGDSLYWLKESTGQLQKCNMYDQERCEMINLGISNIKRQFVILHASRQPLVHNSCENQNCQNLCVLKDLSSVCICPNGHVAVANHTCDEDPKMMVKFEPNTDRSNEKVTRSNGRAVTGIVIASVTSLLILGAYYYYQRMKLNPSKKTDLSIFFRNPTFSRREELANLTTVQANLLPGEHEYFNPLQTKPQRGSEVIFSDHHHQADISKIPN